MDNKDKAIALYCKVTEYIYNKLLYNGYEVIIENREYNFEYLSWKYHYDKVLIVRDDFNPPYLTQVQNVRGRVVHDYIHYENGYDFSKEGEFKTCDKQVELYLKIIEGYNIPCEIVDLMIKFINSEIKSQVCYYELNGCFPNIQFIDWEGELVKKMENSYVS